MTIIIIDPAILVMAKFYISNASARLNNFAVAAKRMAQAKGLNVFFASLCVIDLFGVFPIIALPAALISCGFYGIPLLIFVITVQIYTAIVLGKCWIIAEKMDPSIAKKSRYPYAAVAELIYGKRMRVFVTTLLNLTVFGAGIPNILVASQNLQLIGHRISDGNFYFSFCYWLIVLGVLLCPIMWLGSPKNMKTLASISVVTVISVSSFIWICILRDETDTEESFTGIQLTEPNYLNLLKTYGMIAFQFDIHPMLMTIEVDMQQKWKISDAVSYGLAVTCLLSITTTMLAVYQYGAMTTANILEILPKSNLLYAAILLVTLQLCLSNAVGSSALFQNIEEYLHIPRDFNTKRCLLRSLLTALAVVIAELVPRFDLVMGIIGGTLTGPLIFILPPLFYRRISRMEIQFDEQMRNEQFRRFMMTDEDGNHVNTNDKHLHLHLQNNYGTFAAGELNQNCFDLQFCCRNDSVLSISVIVFGLIATLTSTYFNLLNVSSLTEFWSPCINNISYSFIDL